MFDFKGFISALLRKKSDAQLENLKSATIWVQELPDSDVQEAQDEIIKVLGTINSNEKTPLLERIQVLMYLDEKASKLQDLLCREYLSNFNKQDATERLYLPTILSFWEEMAESYQLCVREFANNPSNKKIWKNLPLLTTRAIRCYAMQAKWSYIRYMQVDAHVWRNLHRLYLFAEREKFAQTPLRLYPHFTKDTTCTAEYMQALLLQLANPESLLPNQINMVDHWLDTWASSITIEDSFRPHRQIYAVNLGDNKPAKKLRRNMIGDKYRYWGVGLLQVTISKTIEHIKAGELPIHLQLSEECRLPTCLELIELLSDRWSGKNTTRKHERQKNKEILQVAQGLREILEQIKPGAKSKSKVILPPAEPDLVEQFIIDYQLNDSTEPGLTSDETTMMGEPELFEHVSDQWMVEDESASGYGAVFNSNGKSRLKVGMLIGLKPDNKKHFAVGIVRRINKDTSSKTHVGIQTLTQTPIAVELLDTESKKSHNPSMDAIYLPESTAAELQRSIIIDASAYIKGQALQLKAQGKSYVIRIQNILEQNDDFVRTSFDVIAKH
ncbi:hypothetical protein [Sulfurirhabdus autotrophica]|uniref:Uncharacterized protein n=1 Tax=Sulfurirhabdus autotrophica TaxID=1706046 RepID=A0A4R3Y0Z3_9PROT|nr:hypothetical protein [Sulfurirhabdus autotrophica]TCV85336.1 hypothetical protein EDC63_1097 [Sulfurirhabdus autotrophica]